MNEIPLSVILSSNAGCNLLVIGFLDVEWYWSTSFFYAFIFFKLKPRLDRGSNLGPLGYQTILLSISPTIDLLIELHGIQKGGWGGGGLRAPLAEESIKGV